MRCLPVLDRWFHFFHLQPMTVRFGRAGNHGFRSNFALFNTKHQIAFIDRTKRFLAVEETSLHKVPISRHVVLPGQVGFEVGGSTALYNSFMLRLM